MLHSMFYGATDGANTAYDYIYNQISTACILTVCWRETEREISLILKKIHWIAFIWIFSIKYHTRKKCLFTLESNQNVSFYLK